MEIINIHNAKTHLSKYIDKVTHGEEIIICKVGKPLVKLIKYIPSSKTRTPGQWKGEVHISDNFDDLPESFMKYFRSDIDNSSI